MTAYATEALDALHRRLDDLQHQQQAVTNLFAMLEVRAAVPPMGGWAAAPDLVLRLVDDLVDRRPTCVVETGSGVSTLWLALAIAQRGLDTRLVSLEHQDWCRDVTLDLLRRHGVDGVADVRLAPLTADVLPGHDAPWYDPAALADLHDVGLLLVDGPPSTTGEAARLPAVPLLRDRLAPDCTIVLDDHARDDEQRVFAAWAADLPDFAAQTWPLQKGAGVLRRTGP